MSGDLISRKDLLGIERLLMTDVIKNNPTARYILEQVLYDIENTQTAYDADKVVEDFEKERNFLFDKNGHCYSAREKITIDKAIEIVKSGGAADD